MDTETIPSTPETVAPSTQRLQQMINELSVEFISILDLDELIERVAQRLREVIDYKFFNLFLVDEARGGLLWKKSVGYNPAEVAAHEIIPFDRSIASAAWREGMTINVGDVSQDSRYLPIAAENGNAPRSEIAVPLALVRDRKIVGVLTIESAEPNYFTRDHERVLNVLGNQLAIALEHARVYDELRQRTREMRALIEIGHEITSILDLDRLLDHIAPMLDRLISYEFLLVGLVDDNRHEFVWHIEEGYRAPKRDHARRTPLTQGVVGRAVARRLKLHDIDRRKPQLVQHITGASACTRRSIGEIRRATQPVDDLRICGRRWKREAGRDNGIGLGGVAHETEFLRIRAEKLRDRPARRREQVVAGLRMQLQVLRDFLHGIQHRLRRRSEPARVEINRLVGQWEESPDLAPKCVRPRRIEHRRHCWTGFRAQGRAGREADRAQAEVAQESFPVETHASENVSV